MKFKTFLMEIEAQGSEELTTALSDIERKLGQLEPDELIDFGEWLEDELGDEYDEEEFGELIDYNSIISVINLLDSEDLDYISYMIDPDDDNDIDVADIDTDDDDSVVNNQLNDYGVDEGISIKFKAKNRNKKKNKRFTLSKAKFRAQKANRKKDNRKNKAARKKNYRKNKVKLKKYNKSYNAAVKSGKHNKKIRR